MFKFFKIFLFNIVEVFVLLLLSDLAIYLISEMQTGLFDVEKFSKYYSNDNNPVEKIDYIFSDKFDKLNKFAPRNPYGTKYKSSPIVLLGCSIAFGNHLKDEQTFGYKLSKMLKRPVYNRAISSFGIQHMYYLSTTDYFYQQVPPCGTVIYVFIPDHFKRMLLDSFFLKDELMLHYKYKNGNLIMDNYDNPLSLWYKKSYTIKALRSLYFFSYMKNYDKITDEMLAYFIKIRENLEKKWNRKVNFVVFFYEYDEDNNLPKFLYKKLEKNNFKVIVANDLTNEDLLSEKYTQPDSHPNEAAWNLLTPLFVKAFKK